VLNTAQPSTMKAKERAGQRINMNELRRIAWFNISNEAVCCKVAKYPLRKSHRVSGLLSNHYVGRPRNIATRNTEREKISSHSIQAFQSRNPFHFAPSCDGISVTKTFINAFKSAGTGSC
jgi:hypothetical protein